MMEKEMVAHLLRVDGVMARAEIELINAANYRVLAEGIIGGLRAANDLQRKALVAVHQKVSEVITENNRLRDERNAAVKALNMPQTEPVHEVKAFAEHWQSMGQPQRFSTENIRKMIEQSGWKLDPKNPLFVPIKGDVWKNTGIGTLNKPEDFVALAQEPSPQADGHVEVPEPGSDAQTRLLASLPAGTTAQQFGESTQLAIDEVQYENFRNRVRNTGPYYTFEAWRTMGRPRG